jgi:hypothetical protein
VVRECPGWPSGSFPVKVSRSVWLLSSEAPLLTAIRISPPTSEVLSFSELYPHLRSCIISHSRSLRLNALKILSSKLVKTSSGEQDVLKRCLQGEEVPLDLHGVRERVLRIGRLGQVVKDDEPMATDLCIRWLICEPLFSSWLENLPIIILQPSSRSTYAHCGRLREKHFRL